MGEGDVVVLGQEAGRGGRVRIGQRPVGHVEQLLSVLVAECRAVAGAAARRPRAARSVSTRCACRPPSRGRSRQVAQHELVDCGVRLERPRRATARWAPSGLAALAPEPARRNLDHGRVDGRRVAQGLRVGVGPAPREQVGELARVRGSSVSSSRPGGRDLGGIRARETLANGLVNVLISTVWVIGCIARQSRAERRWMVARITPARTARRSAISSLSSRERSPRSATTAPRRDLGHLGLHAHQLLDHLGRARARALQQALAWQQRAVERAPARAGSSRAHARPSASPIMAR